MKEESVVKNTREKQIKRSHLIFKNVPFPDICSVVIVEESDRLRRATDSNPRTTREMIRLGKKARLGQSH